MVAIGLVLLVITVPAWLNSTVDPPTRTAAAGETITLRKNGATVNVTPIAGWQIVNPGSGTSLQLRDGTSTVLVSIDPAPANVAHYYQRQMRNLRVGGAELLPGDATTTRAGFTGMTGELVADGKRGKITIITKADSMVTVMGTAEPSRFPQLQTQLHTLVASVRDNR